MQSGNGRAGRHNKTKRKAEQLSGVECGAFSDHGLLSSDEVFESGPDYLDEVPNLVRNLPAGVRRATVCRRKTSFAIYRGGARTSRMGWRQSGLLKTSRRRNLEICCRPPGGSGHCLSGGASEHTGAGKTVAGSSPGAGGRIYSVGEICEIGKAA